MTSTSEALRAVDDVVAHLDRALAKARAERDRLAAEIPDLMRRQAEEQHKLSRIQALTTDEFLRRCVDSGIDKLSLAEMREKIKGAENPTQQESA
jgi:hypothetical protein